MSFRRTPELRCRPMAAALALSLLTSPSLLTPVKAGSTAATTIGIGEDTQRVPTLDPALTSIVKLPSAAQLQALENLKGGLGDQSVTARWDKATGSLDVAYDFASAPSSLDAESAAHAFLEAHAGLVGIEDLGTLRLERNVQALGGHLLYFQQTYSGLDVAGGGIGMILDGERRVKMISGPYHRNLSLGTTPSLDGAGAVAAAQADLAAYRVPWVDGVAEVLNPALDHLAGQLGPLTTPHPALNVVATKDGARLAYTFLLWSRNPFGLFRYQVDAATGAVLAREDQVRYQEAPLPMTGDIYPTYPTITQELKDEGKISVDANGTPLGQLRIGLRNFDASNAATGLNGTLTGLHAHIENTVADKLPFAQSAKGTWHFRVDDPANLEARTNERDQHGPAAEPAEHQDEIAQFFYINSLLEYVDDLHRRADSVHNRVGQGDFPDTYPNQANPLVGNVHIPNVLAPPTDPTDPAFLDKLLGLDNAFALPASTTVAGQKVAVNPTSYGHGYLLNDLAIDFSVPYHEGMHSISTPIAGFEGAPEGGALNEGQADLWAYTAAEDAALGAYVINGFRLRQRERDAGRNPDARGFLRHGDSGLSYSQLGTLGGGSFEVHRDGEIYAAAMWDVRELMLMYQTGGSFKRPDLITGEPTKSIPLGKETWERLFLGATYVLGTFNPDSMVRARDAMIVADQSLYPSDPLDPDAPGLHRALIEQVFAARELGVNAAAPVAGRQTISTQVSAFADSQGKPAAPTGVAVELASLSSARVSWQPVSGAFAYEVLKRQIGKEDARQNAPLVGREYLDGDASTDGYLHVNYVKGDQTSYLDNGFIEGAFVPRGLANPVGSEYVVRALALNPNRQVGLSDASSATSVPTAVADVTSQVQVAFSNITFGGGKTEFDQTLKNVGSGALFTPIAFTITSISNPTVTVANADNAGTGQSGSAATFYFRPTLAAGKTSDPRHIVMANPNMQFFTFEAVVTARVLVDPSQATRYEPEPPPDLAGFEQKTYTDVYTGIVPASDTGLQLAGGVSYVDVPFTSPQGAVAVVGIMTSELTGLDLDLHLRDAAGNVLARSESGTPNETVSAATKPNTNYVYRVIGWAGAAQDFRIESTQTALVPKSSSSTSSSGGSSSLTVTRVLQFTVNPLTGKASVLLK